MNPPPLRPSRPSLEHRVRRALAANGLPLPPGHPLPASLVAAAAAAGVPDDITLLYANQALPSASTAHFAAWCRRYGFDKVPKP